MRIIMLRIYLSVFIFITLVLPPAYAASPKQSVIATRYIELGSLVSIKSIALLEVPNPAYYNFGDNTGSGAFFFGILGGLAEGSAVGGDSKEYGNFNFAKIIQETLKKHLQGEDYEVIQVAVNRKNKFGLVEDYNSVKIKGVDALLDIAPVEIGYKQNDLAGVFSSESGPIITVVVRLISAATREVLYADTIRYGWKPTTYLTDLDIESPSSAQFKNNNDLKANKERAIQFLIWGIEEISMHIAGSLSKNPSIPVPELDSDDDLLFVGKAAEEIATKSYDVKLWQEALSLANGDTVKRNGIYIKLRSKQLALEKKKVQAAANQNGNSVSGYNITGTYMTEEELLSTIPGSTVSGISNRDGKTPWTQDYGEPKKGIMKGKIKGVFGGSSYSSTWKIKNGQWCEDWGSGKSCVNMVRVDETHIRIYERGKSLKNLWELELPESGTDIDGTYGSEITGIHGLKADNAKITIKQSGNKIVGTNISKKDNDINGTREGDTIKFKYWTQWREYTGKWKISANGNRLEGSFENINGYGGKWKLTRIK